MPMDKRILIVVFAIRLIYAGIHIITKEAFNGGINTFVFVFYRQLAASFFLIPVSVIFGRKRIPQGSLNIFSKMFMLSLIGIAISLNTSSLALRYTSSSLSAATENTIPVITFLLAVIFRMEKVNMKKLSGITKMLGVILFIAGIVTVAFYRGPLLKSINHHHFFGKGNSTSTDHGHAPSNGQWMIGCFMMIVANIEWCLWLLLQGNLLKEYPSKLLFTTIQVVFSTIQSFVIALVGIRDLSQWKIGFDVRLVSILYCGCIVTGVSFYLQTWCIEKVGPVFLAATTPLSLVMTIACLSLILGETIELGSVLGGALMVGGLYNVLLGKSRKKAGTSESIDQLGEECKTADSNNV